MNLACSPAEVVGKLVIQIQNLVTSPDFPLNTPERSPLFQIAAHLEIPPIPPAAATHVTITDKTFAGIRQEALKTSAPRGRKKIAGARHDFSTDSPTAQLI